MYVIGQVVRTKKPHVCKNDEWEVLRIGVDIKLKCLKCDRIILISKVELDKRIKK